MAQQRGMKRARKVAQRKARIAVKTKAANIRRSERQANQSEKEETEAAKAG
ncbi:MAG TPA: hypothetical protein V6C69_13570 [Trichormus sp.]|jgi:hypothetical protein